MNFDLYRLYFPAGIALGFWGALVWVLYSFNLIEYPGALHPEIMMGGFLLAFVTGFLCTAVPKFTDSFPPSKNEISFSTVLIIFMFGAQLTGNLLYFRISSLAIFIFLIIFMVRRFLKRRANPPPPFVFVGFGVLSGVLGSLILLLSSFDFISENIFNLGRLFIVQGYIFCFVLGVGSRLIPSLLGFAPPPNQAQKSISIRTYSILGMLFFSTYFVEAFISVQVGMILRDLIFLFIAFVPWKIYQLPKRKAVHAWGLWISCWFLLIGHIGGSLFLDYKIHFMHLFYIGGLSLLTLLVATRVILSHGGHDLSIEFKSKKLIFIISIISLAGLTRFTAGVLPTEYDSHLLYAAGIWLMGLVVWSLHFLPKVFKIS